MRRMSANDSVPRFDRTARGPRGGGSGGGRRARTSLRVFPPFFLRRLPPPSAPPPRHAKQLMAVRSAPDVVTKVDVLTDGSRLRERRDAGSHRASRSNGFAAGENLRRVSRKWTSNRRCRFRAIPRISNLAARR